MVLLLALVSPNAIPQLNWNGPRTYQVSGRSNGHSYRVVFEQANFQPRGRKLLWVIGTLERHYLDGVVRVPSKSDWADQYSAVSPGYWSKAVPRPFWGGGYFNAMEVKGHSVGPKLKPKTELTRVKVSLDGKTVHVPRTLYWDLLNPNLDKEYVRAKSSPNGQELTIQMFGADAAYGYLVQWKFRKNGRHTRTMLDSESGTKF